MTSNQEPILLKNGFIIDGSGSKGFKGNLLIQGKTIREVSRQQITGPSRVIDCTHKTITPGFIDMHSHNDWFLPNAARPELTTPFTEQGITTFVGTKTWKTFDKAMNLIDRAMADGVDLMLDTYAYHCGASIITVLLPDWFMATAPASFSDKTLIFKARLLAAISFLLLGFGFNDIQIASAVHEPFNRFNGMFLSDIAKERTPYDSCYRFHFYHGRKNSLTDFS